MKILGLSCFYHDAAAALIVDGKVIAAAEEERFSRIKHDSDFPAKSIHFCLSSANITKDDLDWIVFYEKPFLKFERITLSHLATAPYSRQSFVDSYKIWLKSKLWIKSIIAKETKVNSDKILFSNHHISHAASSYYLSPFLSAALFTCDGVGEWTTTAWGSAKGNKISLDYEIKFPHSLGLFYSTFTQYLGFQVNEGEFKVMGLAPYGKAKYVKEVEKLIDQNKDGSFRLNLKYFKFHLSDKVSYSNEFIKLFGIQPMDPKQSDNVQDVYADIAASAQKVLDEKIVLIAKNISKKSKAENLCYSGGVALNGVTNWKIFREAGFRQIYIHPAAGDSGGALGAALYLYHHVLGNNDRQEIHNVYFGRKNSEDEIKLFLQKHKLKAKKLADKELIEKVAALLAKKKVIGWVRGRFEWGPRALGARSILADPRSKEMKDLVNAKIKFREAFRPFAPVCTYEDASKYFAVGKGKTQQPLQFMIAVVPVVKKYRALLGAVTHVDGTARPQFIKREENPVYHDLVTEFGKKTGISVLLNTSFNLKGEPIVNTCEDAYQTFLKSGIDYLVLENYLISK